MRIVRELADEGNSIAKIAFMTRLTESVVREALSLLASSRQGNPVPEPPWRERPIFLPNPEGKSVGSRWTAVQRPQSCGDLAPEEVGTGTRPGHRPLTLSASAAELQKSSMTR